jgi:23S rRNA (guanine745-N1)-methyltransferase
MLLCPVRGCGLPLTRTDRRVACERGHSFDVARSGYVNLLQPQDRRSRSPGDSAEAVAARRRLHERGVTRPLLDAIAGFLGPDSRDVVLDAGCGDGFDLGSLQEGTGCSARGIDISVPAVNAAAKRYPSCEWIVANVDRFIPYDAGSFSIVLSITGRMNVAEFRRVMREGGRLLAAVPAPDDLKELRSRTQEEGRDRTPTTIHTFAPHFSLIDRRRATSVADLDAAAVQDVLLSIYRPFRREPVEAMRLTFSLDLLLFA